MLLTIQLAFYFCVLACTAMHSGPPEWKRWLGLQWAWQGGANPAHCFGPGSTTWVPHNPSFLDPWHSEAPRTPPFTAPPFLYTGVCDALNDSVCGGGGTSVDFIDIGFRVPSATLYFLVSSWFMLVFLQEISDFKKTAATVNHKAD